ncbi:hypothetical protein KC921_03985 [Candidatus Woesebacteria bacterium]|nr:hypothetical protein [Candidatus Woesebacteria bacterium]
MKQAENERESRTVIEKFQSWFRLAFAKAVLEVLSKFEIEMVISPESLEQLQKIDTYLKHGSIIVYANHTSMLDAFLGIPTAIAHLPHLRKAIYLLAEKYAIPNSRKKASFVIAPITKVVNSLGVVAVPVPQRLSEQADDRKKQRGKKRLAKYEAKRDYLMNKEGSAAGFTPEATRDESITMTQFKDGVVKTVLMYPDSLCCPFGLIPLGGKTFELVVGEPKLAQEMTSSIADRLATETDPVVIKQLLREVTDQFGFEVAQLLPENMRGYYSLEGKE